MSLGQRFDAPELTSPSGWCRDKQAVAWVAEVLDDLLGLPVSPGAVDVLEGRQCAPGDTLGRMQHPVESPAVADSAVAIPGGDTAQQDALNGASVIVCERTEQNVFSLLSLKRHCCAFTTLSCFGAGKLFHLER